MKIQEAQQDNFSKIIQKNMMKQKQRIKAFEILLTILVLSISSCAHRNSKQQTLKSESHKYDDEWVNGRRLYLDNCSACHPGYRKDSIFMEYNNLNRDRASKRISIESILRDSNHSSLGSEVLGEEQIELLIKFIETPQKRGTVD